MKSMLPKKRRLISTYLGKTHKYSYIVFQLALAITNSARLLIFRAAKVTIIKSTRGRGNKCMADMPLITVRYKVTSTPCDG